MKKITDLAFLKTLYGWFCHRRVSTHDDLNALGRLWVEVHDIGDGRLTIHVCGGVGPGIELGWKDGSAWPARYSTINNGLRDADEGELTGFVARFLRKHSLIDAELIGDARRALRLAA